MVLMKQPSSSLSQQRLMMTGLKKVKFQKLQIVSLDVSTIFGNSINKLSRSVIIGPKQQNLFQPACNYVYAFYIY